MRLSLPMAVGWLLNFFTVFHFILNIISELIYFADRRFYGEWWNCKNLGDYWRLWNLPVHYFFVRHVSNPLLKNVILLGIF